MLPSLTNLPFKLVETISYDPAAQATCRWRWPRPKATKADFLLLVCRLNDSILMRREMVQASAGNPMGMISPGSPGMYEDQFLKALGKLSDYCISNNPWFNPKGAPDASR